MDKIGKALLWTIGPLLVIGLILRLTILEVWRVPKEPYLSASLAPTLKGGDLVLLLRRGERTQGDLVRCPDPEKPNSWVVGRLIGFPGDKVEVKGDTPVINGNQYKTTEACKNSRFMVNNPESGHATEMRCARVEMGGDWHYQGTSALPKPYEAFKKDVGVGRVFLLSDNRTMHDDSRDFGTVEQPGCNRKIVFRLWSAKGWLDSEARMTVIH